VRGGGGGGGGGGGVGVVGGGGGGGGGVGGGGGGWGVGGGGGGGGGGGERVWRVVWPQTTPSFPFLHQVIASLPPSRPLPLEGVCGEEKAWPGWKEEGIFDWETGAGVNFCYLRVFVVHGCLFTAPSCCCRRSAGTLDCFGESSESSCMS